MTRRKASYLQGTLAAPYKLPAEDHRLNGSALWTPDMNAGLLGVRSGIVHGPNSPGAVTVTTGGVNVAPFHAVVQGSTSTTQGAYLLTSDGIEFRALTPASSTQYRRARLVVRLYDQVSGTDAADDWDIEVVYGGAAASAAAAALPAKPGNSLELRQALVNPDGSIVLTGSIPWTVPRGATLPVADQATRLALAGFPGLRVLELDTTRRYFHTGAGWVYEGGGTPPVVAVTVAGGWSGGAGIGVYIDASGIKHLTGWVSNTNTFTPGGNELIATLPTGFAPVFDRFFSVPVSIGHSSAQIAVNADRSVRVAPRPYGASIASGAVWGLDHVAWL